jgi:CheY-like chemotaxis protein
VLGWLDLAAKTNSPADLARALDVAREHAQRGHVLARRAIGSSVESKQSGRTARALASFASISVEPQANARAVGIVVEALEGTDAVLEGEASLLQVLTNLLLNAIAFSPAGGKIQVRLERVSDTIRFSVQDAGPGVPADRARKLFSARTSGRAGGAGIGLSHSRALARQNGGDLELIPSVSGACFELTWPLGAASAPRSAFPPALRAALEGARILLIEDDAAVTTLVEMTLEARGAEIIAVSELSQLRAVLARKPVVDVVLMDLSPVEGELNATLAELAATCPHAALVLMSGQPGGVPSEVERCFQAWVRKPFDMGQLVQTVAELVSNQRAAVASDQGA